VRTRVLGVMGECDDEEEEPSLPSTSS
jgi:hypothetical protein